MDNCRKFRLIPMSYVSSSSYNMSSYRNFVVEYEDSFRFHGNNIYFFSVVSDEQSTDYCLYHTLRLSL